MSETPVLKREPILRVGNYGVHVILSSAGHYTFFGTVPTDLKNARGTYDECLEAFVAWFKALPADEKRKYAGDLRDDVFVKCFEN